MTFPSGQQYVIRHGDQEAVLTEVGAGIRTYRGGGGDILDGFPEDAMCDGAHGQSLLPWPNRVRDGRYTWAGTDQQLSLTEVAKGNAIHGLTRWANWLAVDLGEDHVSFEHQIHAQPGWPFLVHCRLAYRLAADGLTVDTTLTNVGGSACPVGAGAHPYLSPGPGVVDDCELTVPAEVFLPTDDRGIPTTVVPVEGTDHDLRTPRRIGDQVIDEAFTRLSRGPDGRSTVVLARADGSSVRLWAGEGYSHLEIFTGDTLAPDRRRRGLGVEPMTAPPNALQTGEGLVTLPPGRSLALAWGVGAGPQRSQVG